jgi:hypothetical protein
VRPAWSAGGVLQGTSAELIAAQLCRTEAEPPSAGVWSPTVGTGVALRREAGGTLMDSSGTFKTFLSTMKDWCAHAPDAELAVLAAMVAAEAARRGLQRPGGGARPVGGLQPGEGGAPAAGKS